MDEHFFEIIRKEEDGSRTCVRRVPIPSRTVLRILGEWFREKLRIRRGRGRRRARGRPPRKDVTKAFQLIRQGVPRKEIYELLHIVPAARHAFRQALWLRKRRQEQRALRKKTAYSS